MPFYEYECTNCKFYVEALQKISEPPLRKCPSCKKQTLQRLVSAPVFRLKGGGWYETDFKSDQEGQRNLAKEEAEPAAADKPTDDKAKAEKPAAAAQADKPDKKPAARRKAPARKIARPAPKTKTKPRPKAKPKAVKRRR